MSTASVYVRLSREARDSNLSLQGMVAEARQLAERSGYDVIAERVDDGISGAVRDRREFQAWLDDARSGEADALVTYHAERLTREGVNVAALVLDVIEGKDPATGRVVRGPVRLLTVDGLDSREADSFRWRFVIAAEVARAERQRIQARNVASRRRLTEAGRFAGGVVPFGCEVEIRDGGKYLRVCEPEAEILRGAAQRLVRGDSIRSVVGWLDGQGCRTRRGSAWQRTTLRTTLLSAPVAEHVFGEDRATYRALLKRFEPKRPGEPVVGRGRPVTNLLAGGMAKCGSCGSTLTTAGKVGTNRRYTCVGKSKGQTCSGGATLGADALDARIEREFLEHYGHTYALELRVTVVGAEDLEEAEEAYETAQQALRDDLTEANLRAAQGAHQRLEEARARPLRREREIWPSEQTYAEQWEAAQVPERAAMVAASLAEPVVVTAGRALNSPTGRGKVPNVDRARVVWRDDVEVEPPAWFEYPAGGSGA